MTPCCVFLDSCCRKNIDINKLVGYASNFGLIANLLCPFPELSIQLSQASELTSLNCLPQLQQHPLFRVASNEALPTNCMY